MVVFGDRDVSLRPSLARALCVLARMVINVCDPGALEIRVLWTVQVYSLAHVPP